MKTIHLVLVALMISLSLLMAGCGGTGTGNPFSASNSATPNYSLDILDNAICAKLTACFGSLSLSQCHNGILPVTNLAAPLGLASGFGSYQAIMNAEAAGTITPIVSNYSNCKSDLLALSCASPQVTSAYNTTVPTDFTNVFNMIPTGASSCAHLY